MWIYTHKWSNYTYNIFYEKQLVKLKILSTRFYMPPFNFKITAPVEMRKQGKFNTIVKLIIKRKNWCNYFSNFKFPFYIFTNIFFLQKKKSKFFF